MPTQVSIREAMTERERLASVRLEITARQRHQELTVENLAAMLKKERKILKAILKEKRKAEDAEEFHRAKHDLPAG